MSELSLVILDDTMFRSIVPYDRLFSLAKESVQTLGGQIKSEDFNSGRVEGKFRYGINPSGIRVDIQFRRTEGGLTETVVKGRVGDSFDVTGAGSEKARAVLNEVIKRLEADPSHMVSSESSAVLSPSQTTAPIVGQNRLSHRGKSKTTVTLLALFLGGLGVHRFYLGAWGWGLVFLFILLLSASGVFHIYTAAILGVLEAIRFLAMKPANFDAKYNYRIVGAFTV